MTTFNTFNSIQHMPLRVFNRTIMFNNIFNDFGLYEAEQYFYSFSEKERNEMYTMHTYIKKFGYKRAKQEAVKSLVLDEEILDEETTPQPA